MTYTIQLGVNFGSGKADLADVGYQLYSDAGTTVGTRVHPATQVIPGVYVKAVVLPSDFVRGYIKWDSGEVTPVYAVETINPQDYTDLWATVEGQAVYTAMLTIGSGSVTVSSPVTASGKLTLISGYDMEGLLRPVFTEPAGSNWPASLEDAEVHLIARTGQGTAAQTVDIEGEVLVATGSSKVVRFAPTATETAPLTASTSGHYDLYAIMDDDSEVPLVVGGQLVVKDRIPE